MDGKSPLEGSYLHFSAEASKTMINSVNSLKENQIERQKYTHSKV